MPFEDKPPRMLQQQPQRVSDPQQQRAGATEFQGGRSGQMEGEVSVSAARDYQQNIRQYLDQARVQQH